MATSIKIEGIDKLMDKLGRLEAIDVLEAPMNRAVLRVQARMADYPTQRTGSTYVRTGTLGRRWTTKVTKLPEGVEGRVGNVTVYGPLVQSGMFQTKVHKRTGWQTDVQVMNEEAPAIIRDFEKAIDEAMR